MENEHRVSMVISGGSEAAPHDESRMLVRRLSTPYHGLPSIIDYDSNTGFITFGQPIEKPQEVVHPRRFKEPVMPLIDVNPNTCRHEYCLTERRRLYGLAVGDKPLGLPWSSGLLLRFPGHLKYQYPIQKSYLPVKRRKKKKALSSLQKKRKEELEDIMNEMIYFYKIVMLAGCIVREATNKVNPQESATSVHSGTSKKSVSVETKNPEVKPEDEKQAEKGGENERGGNEEQSGAQEVTEKEGKE